MLASAFLKPTANTISPSPIQEAKSLTEIVKAKTACYVNTAQRTGATVVSLRRNRKDMQEGAGGRHGWGANTGRGEASWEKNKVRWKKRRTMRTNQ